MPLIMVTNDDGIRSPGLRAAAAALQALGQVVVVAPVDQWSGAGRCMPATSEGRIYPETMVVNGATIRAYGVEGTPAQVVNHGILEILPRRPDLVVSGINYGENVGSGVTISGTVGAALEAASFGIPALAVSLQTPVEHHLGYSEEIDFRAAAHFTCLFAGAVLRQALPFDVDVLKIDVPATATPDTPWRWTRQSRQRYFVPVRPMRRRPTDPGPLGYRVEIDFEHLEPDSDIYALVVDQVVSVTPLSLDLTSRVSAKELRQWWEKAR
ncbi:5'/3'-nucleotidase SurE [Thermoflexus sp.]|uniref:5'/3'-nucleotidase SurE n=1 Tax=Thermoflexus sp. TaxID=1969742 RepID=UPI0025DA0824|nr:5'/3'-nucleotidase SurE [Thermoflexus sp.]MDW8181006.1 5'/3'-nucleotidase SurE [Anaerolineae bacterium]MCS6963625.1 5'/3'-nucleotidase SurE [Thermoflexus sp.]MCS7351548.1 5'/3'-nucleotidase SurE [Thermoflexus sp.]MCX7691331.1 5'/3'-nucleotidase SurE [Thermoflexus sp.]MDW8184766.1 5'/3'-nucleotidase SurE [Anaerolineae bacterium]